MPRILLPLFFLLFAKTIYSQVAGPSGQALGIIIGNVLDAETSKAIPSITVTLQKQGDSTGRSIVTSKDGGFDFERIPFGIYRVSFTGIGYASIVIDSIHVRSERFDFNLGDIRLSKKASDLSEVVVYAEKPLIESRDGKITFNVGESALSSGSNTSELLKNMPLVSNDANGNILLKGKEPKILIDDKPTELNAQQLADLLESLPGSSIEKIEVMTVPPPQYASETGGVINIVTRKGKIGLTGRITVSYGTRGNGNVATNISYRNNKWSANLSAGVGANRFMGDNHSFRTNYYTDSSSYLETESSYTNKNLRPNLRLSVDYELNKRNLFNVTGQVSGNYFENDNLTKYFNINNGKSIYRIRNRNNNSAGNSTYPSLSLTYTWKGKDLRETFRVITNHNFGHSSLKRNFFEEFYTGDGTPMGLDSTQKQLINDRNFTNGTRINYDKPIKWKNSMLSFGSTWYKDDFHNVLSTTFLRKADSSFVENKLLSNDFDFIQTIATFRAGITINFKKNWRLINGAQAEWTKIGFDFHNQNRDTSNQYWKFLPNLTLRKEWENKWNASLTYRKSIRRPGIAELNPSISNNDPYNIRYGNPGLFPQLAHNYDLNFGTYRGKFYGNMSVGYNQVKDIIQSIRTLKEEGKTDITFRNITDRQEYEASLWGGYSFSRQLRINASAGYTYNQYSEYDIQVNKYRNGSSFYTSLNYNFILTDRLSFDGNLRYSAYADPQGRSRSNLAQNFGVQSKYFNKRVIVSVNLIDLFAQQQFNSYTYGPNFSLQNTNNTNTKNIRVAISYNLNKNRSSLSNKQKQKILQQVKEKQNNKTN